MGEGLPNFYGGQGCAVKPGSQAYDFDTRVHNDSQTHARDADKRNQAESIVFEAVAN